MRIIILLVRQHARNHHNDGTADRSTSWRCCRRGVMAWRLTRRRDASLTIGNVFSRRTFWSSNRRSSRPCIASLCSTPSSCTQWNYSTSYYRWVGKISIHFRQPSSYRRGHVFFHSCTSAIDLSTSLRMVIGTDHPTVDDRPTGSTYLTTSMRIRLYAYTAYTYRCRIRSYTHV